jgi:hypothetical protein
VRRLAKPLTYLIVAVQLLLAVPSMAAAQWPASSHAEMPCDEMPMSAGDDSCPCCPDGVDSMTDCLVSCLLAVAATPAVLVVNILAPTAIGFTDPGHIAGTLAEPPLKPPPIA